MRDSGLKSALIGKQRYILGRDALDFFAKLTEAVPAKEAEQ